MESGRGAYEEIFNYFILRCMLDTADGYGIFQTWLVY